MASQKKSQILTNTCNGVGIRDARRVAAQIPALTETVGRPLLPVVFSSYNDVK
jgi:hypothetical protein